MRSKLGPKWYCVAIEDESSVRPLRPNLTPGAFPEGSTTRFQARKLLRKARQLFPTARLFSHRDVL